MKQSHLPRENTLLTCNNPSTHRENIAHMKQSFYPGIIHCSHETIEAIWTINKAPQKWSSYWWCLLVFILLLKSLLNIIIAGVNLHFRHESEMSDAGPRNWTQNVRVEDRLTTDTPRVVNINQFISKHVTHDRPTVAYHMIE